MDEYDYRQADKAMQKKIDAIYGDPARHAFYSCFDHDEAMDTRGPRGGIVRGPKTLCHYCSWPRKGHAEKTEDL